MFLCWLIMVFFVYVDDLSGNSGFTLLRHVVLAYSWFFVIYEISPFAWYGLPCLILFGKSALETIRILIRGVCGIRKTIGDMIYMLSILHDESV